MSYVAEVRIELKPGVADPEGANTKKALELLGFSGVKGVKSVHAFSIELDAASEKEAQAQVTEMCRRLLVNPVVHAPRVTIARSNGAAKPASKASRAATRKAATPGRVTAAKAKATTRKKAAKAAKRATAKGKTAKKPAKKGKARRGGR